MDLEIFSMYILLIPRLFSLAFILHCELEIFLYFKMYKWLLISEMHIK